MSASHRLSFCSRWSPRFRAMAAAGCCLFCAGPALAQTAYIESLSRDGLLAWTNALSTGVARVEWAPSPSGPWSFSWDNLQEIAITGPTISRPVPMFYRVANSPAVAPEVVNVTAANALNLVTTNINDPGFIILDVRTPGEYSPLHIRSALNVNFNSTAFSTMLQKLDRKKVYLVHCASGNRSRQASEAMRQLNFRKVYNLSEAFTTFSGLPGAAAFIE